MLGIRLPACFRLRRRNLMALTRRVELRLIALPLPQIPALGVHNF